MRKFLNNRLSTESDPDHKHIQHLKHDFQVYQLLQSNTDAHSNRQSYIDILNQVTFNNHHKRRQIKLINNQLHSLVDKSQSTLRYSGQIGAKSRQNDLRDFQKKILEQDEIKCNLKIQSEQILKSINLLRGDVCHLLEKNQSTDILEKKTSKVRLVAQDQFKKVNLALQKDHSEISQRNNMQIRFNKKLKNICNSQNNILKKIQGEYVRLQKRKKVINEKINRMQGIMKVLNERQKTKQQTKIVNQRNRLHLEEIMNLLRIVSQIKTDNSEINENEDEQREDGILQSHLSLKTQRFKSKIKEMQSQISQYISSLVEQIQKAQKFFKITSQNLQQNKSKLRQLEFQQHKYIQFLAGCKHDIISKQEKQLYDQKLAQLKRVSSLILIIWQFIENNHNVTVIIDNQNNNDFILSKRQQSPSRFYRKSQQFTKKSSLISEQNNYSNKILAILLYLSGNGEQVNLESDYLMKSMEMTIVMWLRGFKNILQSHQSQKKTHDISDKLKKAKSMESQKFKSTIQILQETSKENHQHRIYRTSFGQQQQDKLKTMLQLISPKKSFITSQNYQHPQHKHHRTEGNEEYCKPSRLKVLQKADHDYYKMLKNVLQIEKENIKKNYDFNKKFNRAKFTQKDIIQEQKRFESKFALQFIQKNEKNDRNIAQSRKTIMSKESSRDKTFRKRRQIHCLTMSNFKVDRAQDLNSSRKQSAKKPKQSFFNPQKLQRKSKLIRQSQEGLNIKESRISMISGKKGIINFAENTINQQY